MNQQNHHPWRRFVALGDSFTEGIGDPDPQHPGMHRGWADRVAEELARTADPEQDLAYANLAVRGKLLQQIRDDQLATAVELQPDLVSLCAGGNDIFRGGDPDLLATELDEMVAELADTGATVVLFNGPDVRDSPIMNRIRGRVAIFNENVRTVAARHDALMADMWQLRELMLPQMWEPDRVHFSPTGHHTIAMMVLDTLNVPHNLQPLDPKPAPVRTWRQARVADALWARDHVLPWVLRRLRGQSSGDGVSAKRPLPEPLFGHPLPGGTEHDRYYPGTGADQR